MLQARNPNAQKSGCIAFLLALAPDGVYQATLLPMHWCALTAPFQLFVLHAGASAPVLREFSFLWHLSVRLLCPAVSWHLALWSPDFPHNACTYARFSRRLRLITRPFGSLVCNSSKNLSPARPQVFILFFTLTKHIKMFHRRGPVVVYHTNIMLVS